MDATHRGELPDITVEDADYVKDRMEYMRQASSHQRVRVVDADGAVMLVIGGHLNHPATFDDEV